MKVKLLPKFVLSLGILGVALTVTISLFSYLSSKKYLEDMYAQRVISGSKSVATMLDAEDVQAIISPGGENSEAYSRVQSMLNTVKKDGNITYLSLVIPDEDSVTFYIDTCVQEMGDDPANQLAYGTDVLYTDAANDEADLQKYNYAWDLYSHNKGTDKPVVTDNSYGYNYTAVSPILDRNGQAIAEIQYILDMQAVRDHLNSFLYQMLGISFSIICVALLFYMVLVKWMVLNPVEKLSRFTTGIIKSGNFEKQKIEIGTGDEIEDLGQAFNFMVERLEDYIENLTAVTAEKERIGAELNVATHIQSSMLPCIFPAFPDRDELDIYATMTPAKEVGGDFYDFFMVDERHIAIVMADVSGKGVPAALFMVIGKTLIKDHTQPGRDLGEVFTEVNNILCESNDNGMFITAFEGVLDLVTGELRYVNAGHEKPFIYRKNGGYEAYKIPSGFVLAGLEDIKYQEQKVQLSIGDKIFQYTDGVTEAMDKNKQLYGMERLQHALNEKCLDCNPEQTLRLVKEDIDAFVGDNDQFDDITMLCLEYTGKMEE
jgi:phosphoserine phosphatase RsbU/P